jgi:hypothetical protein
MGTYLSRTCRTRLFSRFGSGWNMAQLKSPNEKIIRETIEENKELLRLLASNGKSKPDESQ